MTDSNPPEARLLDQLTDELRDEPVADLDFDALENKIVAKVEMERASSRRRTMFGGGLALAAAAAVALFMGQSRKAPEPVAATPPVAPAPRVLSGAEVNGNSLSSSDRVVAKESSVHVTHAKHSEWTLAPGSEARALEVGKRVVVSLKSGSLSAKVVPSEKPETFVVEVKQTRVAVHGTEFSVLLKDDGVSVKVTEGIVAVGPRGAKPRWFLNAGDAGAFALSGQTGSVERGTTAAVVPAETEEPTPSSGQRPAALPKAPPAAQMRSLSERAASIATQCFTKHVNLEAGVRITAKSQMTISLAPSGRLGGVSFDPPLAPQVQACVQSRLARTQLAASQSGAKSQRTVWLSP